ncbi:virulence RhuM family protein [Thiospirochaeta perfilievii]|uniref:virulence RhuM family protein n=1 Tax=Thiospirochaeta perfilievii TaxID=252967 RepID=UPI001CA8EF9F|nr:RhuM family protein [Thiospirochaeta perfilievii]
MDEKNKGEILIYNSKDGKVNLDVKLHDDSLWLTQKEMADLYNCSSDNISLHLKNIFSEGELQEELTVEESSLVRIEGSREVNRKVKLYNLDAIISFGYRVKSSIATQFRIWASSILKDYLIRGYALNEKKLEQNKLNKILQIVNLASNTLNNEVNTLDEAKGIFKVITDYTYALTILDEYDHQDIKKRETTNREAYLLTYSEAVSVINSMKD